MARAQQGQMLAPATQPEVRLLRRWICDQVRDQAAGQAAAPWPGLPSELTAPDLPGPRWDTEHVRTSSDAVVAGDDLNRIVAASPAALELLGWDDDLVGRRIGEIVPRRLRESHIAGFTRHLLTGDGTILDREVRVPALRRDGSEVDVLLLVRRESSVDGRPVFTATLRQA
jgi:PAS domain S-box-containing protein